MTLLLSIDSHISNNTVFKDIEDSSAHLKERVHLNKVHYLNKLIHPQIQKAPKYMFLANVFLMIYSSTSFHKEPSKYLDKFIANWDYKTYGSEVIRIKFIRCVYGSNVNLPIGDR